MRRSLSSAAPAPPAVPGEREPAPPEAQEEARLSAEAAAREAREELQRAQQRAHEAERREREARELAEVARLEQEKLNVFLAAHKYKSVGDRRRRRLRTPMAGGHEFPLHCAVRHNNADIARCLLRARADAALANSAGLTALQYAQKRDVDGSMADMLVVLSGAASEPGAC